MAISARYWHSTYKILMMLWAKLKDDGITTFSLLYFIYFIRFADEAFQAPFSCISQQYFNMFFYRVPNHDINLWTFFSVKYIYQFRKI